MRKFVKLRSSMLSGASYDEETQELSLTFSNGRTYDYTGVPLSVFEGLTTAPSAGAYFNRVIKDAY